MIATSSDSIERDINGNFIEATDYFLVDDDCEGCGTPAIALLLSDLNGGVTPGVVRLYSSDDYIVDYQVTVPAGERRVLMHYVVQHHNRALAQARVEALHATNFDIDGLTVEEAQQLVNFHLLADSDGDRLYDAEEVPLGLDPFDTDSDGDQLLDGFEVNYGLNPASESGLGETDLDGDADGLSNLEEQNNGTNPNSDDSDGDNLSDGDEVNIHASDPNSADSDGDGLTDDVEIGLGTNPRLVDSDSDGDGLDDNVEVYSHATNPILADSDGDGMDDGFEITFDMADVDAADDTDQDGLTNLEEFTAGTDPRNEDTDGDLLLDRWEIANYLTNPAQADSDSGGRRDGDELFADDSDAMDGADELASIRYDQNLRDENGRSWYVDDSDGHVRGSTSTATSFAFDLRLNGQEYTNALYENYYEMTTSPDGRELRYSAMAVGDLRVSRRVFVPSVGGAFIRYLEVIHNPGAQAREVNLQLDSRYYGTNLEVATSDGDDLLTDADDYVIFRDLNNASRPILGHLFAGPNRSVGPHSQTARPDNNWNVNYRFTVPAGERRIVMHLGILDGAMSSAQSNAEQLLLAEGAVLDYLTEQDQADIVNFFAYTDADQDGLGDPQESILGTDPANPDHDGDGTPDGVDPAPLDTDAVAPVIAAVTPPDTQMLVIGETLSLTAQVSDDTGLASVEFLVDGSAVAQDPPEGDLYSARVSVADAATLQLTVRATDNAGLSSETSLSYTISADPGATITGRVVDSAQNPITGATVSIGSRTTTTGADGLFTLSDVATVDELLQVHAESMFGNEQVVADSALFAPPRGTSHDVGDMILQSLLLKPVNVIPERDLTHEGEVPLPHILMGEGNRWDIDDRGRIDNGSGSQYYSKAEELLINGSNYLDGSPAGVRMQGRELTLQARQIGDFNVVRKIYVPENDIYARYIELIENRSEAEQVVTVKLSGWIGSLSRTQLLASSSDSIELDQNDQFVVPTDYFVTDDDCDGCGSPAVGLLFKGATTQYAPDTVRLAGSGYYSVTYQITIPAGERRALMHYMVQHSDPVTTLGKIDELHAADYEIEGLTVEETEQLVNFRIQLDSDNDGVYDADEIPLGLDPFDPDTDNDELSDGFELYYGFNPDSPSGSEETHLDGDNDGLDNLQEQTYGSQPDNPDSDSDGDGLSDGDEVNLYQSDPVSIDSDSDGLADTLEITLGTLPGNADSDGDGLDDRSEIYDYYLDPLDTDSDHDGMSDAFEINYELVGVSPYADSDDDSLTNLEEYTQGTNPHDSDSDDDGRSDAVEIIVDHTDPLDAAQFAGQVNYTHNMSDANGDYWSFDSYSGAVQDATNATTDSGFNLTVNGLNYQGGYNLTLSPDGREVRFTPDMFDGLRVYRRAYVPEATDAFVRYIEVIENPTDSDKAVELTLTSTYANNTNSIEYMTSDGNAVLDEGDDYLAMHDPVNTTPRSLLHVFNGEHSQLEPDARTGAIGRDWTVGYTFVVPSGERRIIMHLAAMDNSFANALTVAETLHGADGQVLAGLTSEEQTDVINFFAYSDQDNDGLSDAVESQLGTLVDNPDSDSDGLLDAFEVRYGFDPLSLTSEASADADSDGLSNLQEQEQGSDPHQADTDGDGLSDSSEVNDYGSNPNAADSDADGVDDAVEVGMGVNPVSADTDSDNLDDYAEIYTHPTDPLRADTDGDLLPDGFEIRYGFDPLNDTGVAELDNDLDGLNNLAEALAGTDPFSDDTDADLLGDGIENGYFNTDPALEDSDGGVYGTSMNSLSRRPIP
ncbi:MAG: hypothetical protein KZQ78_12870 [Candidatus Thiodiazotropha sp. (ex Ustalcina ferruginea)]|nr:hypothetical protein [Candidatus Thiodiazotropha sp. (ex Ustalcina ferruginea)]